MINKNLNKIGLWVIVLLVANFLLFAFVIGWLVFGNKNVLNVNNKEYIHYKENCKKEAWVYFERVRSEALCHNSSHRYPNGWCDYVTYMEPEFHLNKKGDCLVWISSTNEEPLTRQVDYNKRVDVNQNIHNLTKNKTELSSFVSFKVDGSREVLEGTIDYPEFNRLKKILMND